MEGEGWRDWRAEMGRRHYYSGGRRGQGKKAGCQCPRQGSGGPFRAERSPRHGRGEGGSARQRGEGGSHAGAVLRSVLKVYTHTHT